MSQILLTTITNPFDPYGSRTVSQGIWTPAMTVADCVAQAFPLRPDDFDVAAGLNGAIVPDDRWGLAVQSGDCITVCAVLHGGGGGGGGGGKNVVRAVAMLAVIIAAPYAAAAMGLISGGIGMAGMTGVMAYSAGAALSLTGMAVAAGVAVAGLALVNALLPPALPEVAGFSSGITNFAQSSPTYGWDQSASNQDQENIALPVLYGSARVKPPRIAKWVETIGDKQYLNMLFAVAGHVTDSIADIQINDTPATMFTGIETDVRLGALDQTVIPWFHDVAMEQSIGRKLSTSAITMLSEGTQIDKVRLCFTFPSGLFHAADDGGLNQVSVNITTRWHRPAGAWESVTVARSGSQNTALRFTQDLVHGDGLPGQFEIQVYFASEPGSGPRWMTNCYVEYLQEVTNLAFTYPGVSLLAVRALATDQLSGAIPTVTCVATRSTVQVWDPDAGAYVSLPATNPAWQDYDAFHNEDYGGDVLATRMTFADYKEWADWCTASGLGLSIYFDSTINIEQADQMIGQAGRGRVVQKGTDFSCLIDKPGEVVQLFTVGNIKADSFRETFLDLKDRANVIEVTFFDTDSDHQRTTIELRSPLMAEGDEVRKTSVTLYGSVTRTLAINYGYYRLACNDYFLRTVEVEVDVDAIACQVNDVIAIQHDVPQWGYGGRVVAATANTVTLDREVTIQAGQSYRVIVRNSEDDSLQERTVTTGPGTTDLLAIDPPWIGTPVLFDLFSFGRVDAVIKPFRVLSITRATDMTRKITSLEYREEVYQIPTQIPVADQETDLAPVIGLSAQTVWTIDAHGNVSAGVHLYWHGYVLSWPVFQLIDSAWVQIGTANAPRFTVAGLQKNTQYTFAVYDTDTDHQIVVTTEASVAGPDNLAITEELYSTSLSSGVKVKALLCWSEVPMAARYLVRYKKAADAAWIYNGDELTNAAVILDLQAARYDFQVAAVLQSGAVSNWTQHSQEIYGLTSPPSDLSNVRFQIISNQLHIQWDLIADLDVKIGGCIKVRHSSASEASATWIEAVEVGPPISGLTAQVILPVMTGTYLLKAVDSGGRESLNAATFEIDEIDILGLTHVTTITESPAFSGTKTSLTVRDSKLTFDDARYIDQITENIDDWTTFDGQGGLETSGQYLFSQVADAGSVSVYRVISEILFAISAEVDLIDRRTDPMDSWEDLDGTTYSAIQPKFYIACTNDDPAGSATWGPWQQFHVGDYAGRGFRFKLEISGGDGIHQIEISTLKMRIYQ